MLKRKIKRRKWKLHLATRLLKYNRLPVLSKIKHYQSMHHSEYLSPLLNYGAMVRRLNPGNEDNKTPDYGQHGMASTDDELDYVIYPDVSSNWDVAGVAVSSGLSDVDKKEQSLPVAISDSSRYSKEKDKRPLESETKDILSKRNESTLIDSEDDSIEFVGTLKARPKVCTRVSPQKLSSRRGIRKTELFKQSCDQNCKTKRIFHIEDGKEDCLRGNSSGCRKNADCIVVDLPKCERIERSLSDKTPQLLPAKVESLAEDEDLVIVSSNHNHYKNIDFCTLKRIVSIIVKNYVEENDAKKLPIQYVINRLKLLHHRDFSDRLSEVYYCTRRALRRCRETEKQVFQEVRPGVRLTDIDTLSSANWVNDVIINQYMKLLLSGSPEYGTLNSFWHDMLLRGKEPKLPNHWEQRTSILVPTCADCHWSLLCFSPNSFIVEIYSSLAISETEVERAQTLLNVFMSNSRKHPKVSGVELPNVRLPRQENGHDCGVYVCMFARCIVRGNSFSIEPRQVCEFRDWLKKEILKGRLFDSRDDVFDYEDNSDQEK